MILLHFENTMFNKTAGRFIPCLLFCLGFMFEVNAGEIFKIVNHNYSKEIKIIGEAVFYEDSEAVIPLQSILQKQFSSQFDSVLAHLNSARQGALWVKCEMQNITDSAIIAMMDFPEYASISVYCVADGIVTDSSHGGYLSRLQEDQYTKNATHMAAVKIPPGKNVQIYVCLISVAKNVVPFMEIYSPAGADSIFDTYLAQHKKLLLWRHLFLGIVFFQFLYILIQWFIKYRREYLYYSLYLFATFLFFAMRYEYYYYQYGFFAFYLEHVLAVYSAFNFAGFMFYLAFGRKFLELKIYIPVLNKFVKFTEFLILGIIITLLGASVLGIYINNITAMWIGGIVLFILTIIFVVMALRLKTRVSYFFLTGSLVYATGSLASFITRQLQLIPNSETFDNIIFLEMGIVLEMLFFTTGLAHKELILAKEKTIAEQQLIRERDAKESEKRLALIAERNRISQELHDDLGAQLSAAKLFLHSAHAAGNDSNKMLVENSISIIDNSIKDLRRIMDDLHVTTLQEKGYIVATEELVNKINMLQQMEFRLTHFGLASRPDEKTEHNLFRITQELINNTIKYAEAKHVTIEILARENKLILLYEDDGIGFDMNAVSKGHGLSNIISRAGSLNGTAHFDTSPSSGSRTIIELPISYAKT